MVQKKRKNIVWPQDLKGMEAILGKVAFSAKVPGIIRRGRVMAAWPDVVGDKLAEKTEPVSLRDDVLTVRVEDPAWAHELTYMKDDLLDRLKRKMKGRPPKDIRFVTGSVKPFLRPVKKKIPLGRIRIDPKRVQNSMDEEALKGKDALKKLLESLITDTYRLQKYLDGRKNTK